MKDSNIWAAFVVVGGPSHFACTTRPGQDWDEENILENQLAFPGGKLEPGESPREAALREAREEGFDVLGLENQPFHQAVLENGKTVAWFAGESARILADYKEKGRVRALIGPVECLHGFKNEEALAVLRGRSAG